jgi:hypothetical protein
MVNIATISKDLGIAFRDIIRGDATILAFSSADPENWIFFGRPKDQNDKKFPVPRIVIEEIDQIRESYSIDNLKDVFLPYVMHCWIDKESEDAFTASEIQDQLANLGDTDFNDVDKVLESNVISAFNTPEPRDTKMLTHITVRVQVEWRDAL